LWGGDLNWEEEKLPNEVRESSAPESKALLHTRRGGGGRRERGEVAPIFGL